MGYYECNSCKEIWSTDELIEAGKWDQWTVTCPACDGIVPVSRGAVTLGGLDALKRGWVNNHNRSVKHFKKIREKLSVDHGEDFNRVHGTKEQWDKEK